MKRGVGQWWLHTLASILAEVELGIKAPMGMDPQATLTADDDTPLRREYVATNHHILLANPDNREYSVIAKPGEIEE